MVDVKLSTGSTYNTLTSPKTQYMCCWAFLKSNGIDVDEEQMKAKVHSLIS